MQLHAGAHLKMFRPDSPAFSPTQGSEYLTLLSAGQHVSNTATFPVVLWLWALPHVRAMRLGLRPLAALPNKNISDPCIWTCFKTTVNTAFSGRSAGPAPPAPRTGHPNHVLHKNEVHLVPSPRVPHRREKDGEFRHP